MPPTGPTGTTVVPPDSTMSFTHIYNHTGVPVGVVVLIVVAIVLTLALGVLLGRLTALRAAPADRLDLPEPEEAEGAKVIGGRFNEHTLAR